MFLQTVPQMSMRPSYEHVGTVARPIMSKLCIRTASGTPSKLCLTHSYHLEYMTRQWTSNYHSNCGTISSAHTHNAIKHAPETPATSSVWIFVWMLFEVLLDDCTFHVSIYIYIIILIIIRICVVLVCSSIPR